MTQIQRTPIPTPLPPRKPKPRNNPSFAGDSIAKTSAKAGKVMDAFIFDSPQDAFLAVFGQPKSAEKIPMVVMDKKDAFVKAFGK